MSSTLISRALFCWSAMGAFLVVAASMMAPVIFVGSLIAPLLLCDRNSLKANLRVVNPLVAVLLVTAIYLTINASWSLDRKSAGISVAMFYALAIVSHVTVSALQATEQRHLEVMRRGIVVGIALGTAYLCFEYATKMSIQRSLQALLASANITLLRIKASTVEYGPLLYTMNRNVIALVMLTGVVCLLQLRAGFRAGGRVASVLLAAVVAVAAFLSPSATAKIGVISGASMFVLLSVLPRFGLAFLAALWSGLCVLALPIAQLLYKAKLYEAPWLVSSARHRILIWGASADWYWKAPWFGAGVGTARGLDPLDPAHRVNTPGLQDAGLNWHAHNAYVQVWFEAGLAGAILLLLIGLFVLREIHKCEVADRPYLAATFGSAMIMAATAFSIWAAWYLALFGLAAVFAVVGMRAHARRDEIPAVAYR